MKYLISFLFFAPIVAFGQKIEITEQAGLSVSDQFKTALQSGPPAFRLRGFSNQLSVGVVVAPHWVVGASYELNIWRTGPEYSTRAIWRMGSGTNNSFGVYIDARIKAFFAGVHGSWMQCSTVTEYDYTLKYDGTYCVGLHLGTRVKLYKQLSLVVTTGVSHYELAAHYTSTNPYQPREQLLKQPQELVYCRLGVSYAFGKWGKEPKPVSKTDESGTD